MSAVMPSPSGAPARRGVLQDSFGRTITNVRVSVTDRCNFRCRYCMPDNGIVWLKKSDLLSFEEIARLVRVLASYGIAHVRLTGGEPLMRSGLHLLVRHLRAIDGISDIALTTNAYFLPEQIGDLVTSGLDRLNISLDSLDPATFSSMARRDYFDRVWNGVEEADRRGLRPIKINAVLLRGVNDGEIPRFVDLARTRGFIIRFIEFMPIGMEDGWSVEKVIPTRDVLERIAALGVPPLERVPHHSGEPAERYRFADGRGEIGFISSVSDPFCSSCNRIRITSDGKLRTCLFSTAETDLRALLRSGADDDEIGAQIAAAVLRKEEGHLINRPGFVRPGRTMHQIGG